MTDKLVNKINKAINKTIRLGFILGVPLFIYGLLRMLFLPPLVAINLKTQLPFMQNGTFPLIIGIILMANSLYSLKNKASLIQQEQKNHFIEKKKKRNNPKWLKHQ
jgi:Na+/melibiose symporter-like transporter